MDSWNAEQGRGREKRKDQKKEEVDARKDRKVAIHWVFPMICGSGGSKSRLAKAAGAEPAGQMRHEKVHAVVARSTFPSQNGQNTRTTFGSCDVEKVHAVVARSTFWSQNVQNTPWLDHFWKLRCRKSARRCGAKHILKSKCTKHTMVGPLLESEMSSFEKVHAVVARSRFRSQNVQNTPKHTMFGPLLESEMSSFEKVHAVVARSRFRSQNVQSTPCSDHFWSLRCRVLKKCTPLWREAQFQVKMLKTLGFPTTFGGSDVASLRFASLHYTTLHDTTLHYTSSGWDVVPRGRHLLSR